MKLIWQLGIICLVCLAGEAVSAALPAAVPGAMISMVLLFAALCLKWIREEEIRTVSEFLLENMAFFYIPVSVGALEYFDILKAHFVQILLICAVSFFATLLVTYYTVRLVNRLTERGKRDA